GEDECLFTVGSLFEVVEKTYSTNVWIISLTLVNEDDKGNDIARDYQTLKSTGSVEAKLVRVGDLLLDDEKSETYYSIIKQEFGLMAGAHDSGMGWLKYRQKKFEEALEYQLKAVNRYKNDEDHKDVLVMSYCCIGAIHRQKEDNKAALEYYTKASDVGHSIIPVDNIAGLYVDAEDFTRAVDYYQSALDTCLSHKSSKSTLINVKKFITLTLRHPTNYMKIVTSVSEIIDQYEEMKLFDTAAEAYDHFIDLIYRFMRQTSHIRL
ncbi:unnamed protein product, partial [Didymodactylos carnosus]